jgi:hypothetical protein
MLVLDSSLANRAGTAWHPLTRLAFRFCATYFILYVLPSMGPIRGAVSWVARHVFHVAGPLVISGGSGDKTYDWVHAFTVLVVAVAKR